ncbi:YkgJ family cysteine cluster protein [Pseudemcibacter aquimaris]|uniref:YkgJ family cysteine cluster protein n=1 Tax=Pseudemcibacter aquimaris TaxID=2857064 RepID=UPI002012C2B5|nr:YkgJ family cysteine cluster protein [Pseudemcibacter aquimaris]MCC3861565.1 YkgJ family cysteine cluster protein [Pseudemcibacter aquimaris]WDU58334.1 YkgJ family cysteine cluster protein [Pseudemcibacter aquimaris]
MDNTLLVEGRECGKCEACCVELTIQDPELLKLPGVKCQHLSKKHGCTVYENRPKTCRDYYCMWRFMPNLDENWRPDLKGIMIRRAYNGIPKGYEGKIALNFEVIGKKSVIHDMDFIEVLGGFIVNGFPCFLSIGKPRRQTSLVFLNNKILHLIQNRNLDGLKATLTDALKHSAKNVGKKMYIEDGEII